MTDAERAAAAELYEAAKVARDAAASLMRALAESGHGWDVLDELGDDEARIAGFGVRLQDAIEAWEKTQC